MLQWRWQRRSQMSCLIDALSASKIRFTASLTDAISQVLIRGAALYRTASICEVSAFSISDAHTLSLRHILKNAKRGDKYNGTHSLLVLTRRGLPHGMALFPNRSWYSSYGQTRHNLTNSICPAACAYAPLWSFYLAARKAPLHFKHRSTLISL